MPKPKPSSGFTFEFVAPSSPYILCQSCQRPISISTQAGRIATMDQLCRACFGNAVRYSQALGLNPPRSTHGSRRASRKWQHIVSQWLDMKAMGLI